jgi:hypothetical protein
MVCFVCSGAAVDADRDRAVVWGGTCVGMLGLGVNRVGPGADKNILRADL